MQQLLEHTQQQVVGEERERSVAKVIAMDTKRRDDLRERVTEFMGKKHYAYLNGAGMIFNSLGKLLFGKDPTPYCFLVDDEKLSALRAEAKAKPGAPDRISANDVLTSFGVLTRARVLSMAINFRNRIDGLTLADAGNYHHGLLFDPRGYARPGDIRHALSGPPPLSRSLPYGGQRGSRSGWRRMRR